LLHAPARPADDAEHVNPNGGAIALGHPLGMSGARIALTAAHQLRRSAASARLPPCASASARACRWRSREVIGLRSHHRRGSGASIAAGPAIRARQPCGSLSMPMSPGYVPFHPTLEAEYGRRPARSTRTATCFGPEGAVPVRAEAQIHPLRSRRRKSCSRCATFWLRQERHRAGDLPRHRQPRTGRCLLKNRTAGQGRRLRRREISDAELKALHQPGVRGVRFNFIKRLVDSTPARRDAADRERASPSSAGTS
jgi:hypothetical protein